MTRIGITRFCYRSVFWRTMSARQMALVLAKAIKSADIATPKQSEGLRKKDLRFEIAFDLNADESNARGKKATMPASSFHTLHPFYHRTRTVFHKYISNHVPLSYCAHQCQPSIFDEAIQRGRSSFDADGPRCPIWDGCCDLLPSTGRDSSASPDSRAP